MTFFTFLTVVVLLIELGLCEQFPSREAECANRWIHIRRLPRRFNLDLAANCSEYPLFDDLCPHLANHGLGPKTHNRSRSWFRTDPYVFEVLFHRRILGYPCLTPDPSLADAVYLPYYAGLDALRFLYGPDTNLTADHGLDLYNYLRRHEPGIWARRSGADHFLVMARPAWDFSQQIDADPPIWGTSFLELPEFFNVTALTFESRPWPWQEQAIPYPTSFHPPTLALYDSWAGRVRRSRRTTLMVFAGGGGTAASSRNIRRSIRTECEEIDNATSPNGYSRVCEIVDCSGGSCEHDPIRFMRPMLKAAFCLQPPGETPTRRSTFDGIVAGCVPVFFEEQSARSQYGWHLPEDRYEDFSVFIPKDEVVSGGLRIGDVLAAIPEAEVRRMREVVVGTIMPRIMYRAHGSSVGLRAKKDAFDLALEGTLDRIKSRLDKSSSSSSYF